MKKLICIILALGLFVGVVACQNDMPTPSEPTAAPVEPSTPDDTTQTTTEPEETPASGGRIAVIRNMTNSDHTAQFFAGCIEEGEALGYTVDTFMSDGDDIRMQDLMEQALLQDYDIWIVSHANEGYQYDLISRAVAQGVYVTGFDCGGDPVPGVTYTSQDDASLASISLDAMIEKAVAEGAETPVKFIAVNILGLIVPFDNRQAVIEEYVAQGKMELLDIVNLSPGGDYYSETHTAISSALARYGPGEINGVWTATTFFLDGIVDAVQEAGRSEIVLTGVDISDTEIQRLVEVPELYAIAAVDPFVIGVVNVRLAVAKVLGLPTPDTFLFPAVGITGDVLSAGDTMTTLSKYFDDFGSTDMMLLPELVAIRNG